MIEGARCLLFQSGLPYKYWNTAVKCFADSYNFSHYDSKKGTNGHVERHGHKFKGIPLPYGCKVRYLPHAEREVEQREKLEPSLRDGIFVGYRSHSGGRWTQQYEVIDAEAFSKVVKGSGRRAHVHSVSEIYVPGSAADDNEEYPTFPVADGHFGEAKAPVDDEESSEEPVDSVESLQTQSRLCLAQNEEPSMTTTSTRRTRGALVVGMTQTRLIKRLPPKSLTKTSCGSKVMPACESIHGFAPRCIRSLIRPTVCL